MILIKKIIVEGRLDANITVPDVEKLEEIRSDIAKSYGGEHPFEISFILQTGSEQVHYPTQKKVK